jgi:hypothetical protein
MADSSPTSRARANSLPRSANAGTRFKNFLPLVGESSALTTRGQNLPNLFSRRPSTLRSFEGRGSLDESEDDVESFREGLKANFEREAEQRMSGGAATLHTPQMRSQRLIGNSNARYKWSRYYKSEKELTQMKKPM